jgi:glyoxylase-like metal-dependent hydrolase (beta-lactamase superfamily II)
MSATTYRILMQGFPGRSERGFLGWSTIVLFHTADGPALLDTGGAGDRPGLMAALTREGLVPGDIRTLYLSHLHFDHVGNVECFPQARVVLHEDEVAYFHGSGQSDPAMPLFLAQTLLAQPRLEIVTGEPELAEGLRLIRTPGHSGGHASLVLDSAEGCIVFAQDALKNRTETGGGPVPGAVDGVAAEKSAARICAMADLIVPGHDVCLRRSGTGFLPLAPQSQTLTITLDGRTHVLEA